jgi:hypothetical protein
VLVDEVQNKGTGAVCPCVLGQVVAPGELLAALKALERLVVRVQRPVVTLEVLLATEPAVAELANKRLGRVLGKGLLTSAAVGGRGQRVAGRSGVGTGRVVGLRGAGTTLLLLLLLLLLGRGLLGRAGRVGGRVGSDVHGGHGAAAVDGDPPALGLVSVAVRERGDGAGDTGDKGLGVVEAEVLLAKAKGDNTGSGAGTGAAGISVVVAKVDEFVDKVVVC